MQSAWQIALSGFIQTVYHFLLSELAKSCIFLCQKVRSSNIICNIALVD